MGGQYGENYPYDAKQDANAGNRSETLLAGQNSLRRARERLRSDHYDHGSKTGLGLRERGLRCVAIDRHAHGANTAKVTATRSAALRLSGSAARDRADTLATIPPP